MAKKIQIILDVDGKPIDVAIDATMNLKQQFRELTKELNRTKEGTKEFELLSTKLGDVRDRMETTTAKSRDLFGSLSLLPGPVGAFAGQVDGAISSLKLFSSFNLKDLKFQLGETLNDFKDIASNIGKATGITKVYTVLNNALAKSFVAVGAGEAAAAAGARAFAAALTATGIGALIVLLGLAASALYDLATGEDEAAEASARLNRELESQNQLLDLNQKAAKRRNAETLALMKAQGKSEADIRKAQIDMAYKDYSDAFDAEEQSRKLYNANLGKASAEDLKKLGDDLAKKEEARKDAYSNYIVTGRNAQAAELADQKAAGQKSIDANKQKQEKIAQDNKAANEALLDLQRENAVLAIQDQRKREDKELENQKLAEEDKIKQLQISEDKKRLILDQIATKYNAKQNDLNNKRGEEDAKSAKEWADKLEDIRITAIQNQQEREKAELKKGYDNTKADLDKALEDKKISQEQYNQAIINLQMALAAAEKKIDDDKTKEDQDKRLKKLDDELRFLQIKGEALRQGTQQFYDNQREILKASEERELADVTLTEEMKLAIRQKYAKLNEDLRRQEVQAIAMQVSQMIDTVGQIASGLASLYDEEAKTSKEAFEKRKKLQIASAIIGGASAIINVLAAPPTGNVILDGILKGLRIGAVILQTGAQIKKIKETQFEGGGSSGGGSGASAANLGRNYEEGGMIKGPRHAQGGVLINAEGGEAVMTRGAVTMFAPLLSALNQAGGGTSFSTGATGGARPDNPITDNPAATQQPIIMKTYVVSNELTTEVEKQARLKDLSTL
jgi:hypothetical protein